ncbi:MAG: hypothetical protein CFH21_00470, partial [Alphaproteobacteria bacterium MarineAlpha5_Bin11]
MFTKLIAKFKNNLILSKKKWFIWNKESSAIKEINNMKTIPSILLVGIEYQKETIYKNTVKFAKGFKSNNALLWGTRGNGKSTIIKSIFNEISKKYINLKLVQLEKKDLDNISDVYNFLEIQNKFQFIIFIDDLSFENDNYEYKKIKSILDGGIKNQPNNILIYATSNRRHLISQDMIDNEKSSAIHTHENVEEKISLSDRFGLWIGFHNISQDEYLKIIKNYNLYFK